MPKRPSPKARVSLPPAPPAPAAPTVTPIHRLTVSQWKASPALQGALRQALDNSVLQLAFETLLRAAMPSAPPALELVPGISADAINTNLAHLYSHRSGMTAFHTALNGLTIPRNSRQQAAQWGALEEEPE